MKHNSYPTGNENFHPNEWSDINFHCDCKTNTSENLICDSCCHVFENQNQIEKYDYERNIRIRNGFKPQKENA